MDVVLPLAVPKLAQAAQPGDLEEVDFEVEQLPVGLASGVGMLERTDDQSVLFVVYEIPAQVVEHYGIVFVVDLGELAP